MPAYQVRISGEISLPKDLDGMSDGVGRVKHLIECVKRQALDPAALQTLSACTNLHIDTKMVGRAAKVVAPGESA